MGDARIEAGLAELALADGLIRVGPGPGNLPIPVEIVGNHRIPGGRTCLEVSLERIRLRDAVLMSRHHPHARAAITVATRHRRWWGRALVAVARWLLRRAA